MSMTVTRNPNLTKTRQQNNYNHELKSLFGDNWWTGVAPEQCPGFDKDRQCLNALPLINLDLCSRQDVLDYFNNSWTLTELLFSGLKVEEVYKRPPYHALRHPLIFYYGHPAVLYLNKMRIAGLFKNPVNLYLEKILETGVDEMSWDDMGKNEMEWPSVATVRDYRKTIYDMIVELIKTHPEFDKSPGERNLLQNSPWWSLWMGFEHEKIHFETSSVLIRELPIEYVETPKYWAPLSPSKDDNAPKENSWIKKEGTQVSLGKPENFPSYGWDNEYGERTVKTKDFEYTRYQITNREFYDFVASGAYIDSRYWREEGKAWRKFRNTKRPTFWAATGPEGAHEYELRTIFEIIPMPWNWPAEVNFHEAVAYTNWRNEVDQKNASPDNSKLFYRLLTEAEYVSLQNRETDVVLQSKTYGAYQKFNDFSPNFNFKYSSPENVSDEILGNVWHWMEDQFNPLENFKVHYLYDDFSTPCYDGKHQMILGGSYMSCGDEASHWSRFHFRPHFYQHSGFRMARSLDGSLDNGAKRLLETNEYIHPRRQNVLDQMSESADWWKKVDQPLEMNEEEMKILFTQTQNEILEYMHKFPSMHPMGLAHDPATNSLKKDFSLPYQMTKNFPERPESYQSLLKFIFGEMAPLSQLPGHPGFAAYVAASGNTISNTAQMIAQTLNPFTGHYMMAPGLVALEQEVVKWFIHLMGYDDKALGYLTTGGSQANMNAIMLARKEKIKGHDFSKVTGYMSSDAHHSLAKGWVMLGLPKENLRLIKTENYKMKVSELEKAIADDKKKGMTPFIVIGTTGTTKTGSVDPIADIAKVAARENLWFHIDGAYGALFMLTEKGRGILSGIHLADSIGFDPHKTLALPYGTGCLLVKEGSTMNFDYISDDSYMPPTPTQGDHDFADITPELSRDYRGLRVWLPIKTLGIAPFVLNLEEKLKLIEWAATEIKAIPELEMVASPELTILAFAHKKGDAATKKLLEKINNRGTLFLSSCMLDGKFAIRICLVAFRIHFTRLENGLSEMAAMAKEC